MAAPVPFYSSSAHPSALATQRSLSGIPVSSSPKDSDGSWYSDSSGNFRMRPGGLSSLLGGAQAKAVSATLTGFDVPAGSSSLVSPDQFRSEMFHPRSGSQAMSIPSSSFGCKDRSPASVFSVDSSARIAAVSPKVNSLRREHSHASSIEASSKPRRRSSIDYAAAAQPQHRSVGFAVKQSSHCLSDPCVADLPSKPEVKMTRRSALRSGLASIQGLVDSMSDLAVLTHADRDRVGEDKVAWAREEVLKIVHESEDFSVSSLSGQPTRSAGGLTPVITDEDLLQRAQAEYPVFNDPLVRKAFTVASVAHQNQYRKSGEPVIQHCLATAEILAGIGADSTVVAAGLLHDVIDDTPMSEQQLADVCGSDIADLVAKVSRVSTVCQLMRDNARDLDSNELLLLRSMLLAMGSDVRIVLVKLADRLHNLRTLHALPAGKQQRMARQTLELFAPLANRLGIWSWKAEMEDLCFRYLHPEEHADLERQVREQGKGEEGVAEAIHELDSALREAGVRFEDLSGRPKNLYSIFQKMQKKDKTLNQIFDLWGLRLICPDEAACYAALEVVHSLWSEKGGRHFKDYILNPKANGYQSIHTVVQDIEGNSLEVQIRTSAMHQHAEFGVAAHWRYKEDDGRAGTAGTAANSRSSGFTEDGDAAAVSAETKAKKGTWSLPAQQQAQVEWARFCLSWVAERPDTKVRVSPPASVTAHSPAGAHGSAISRGVSGAVGSGISSALGSRSGSLSSGLSRAFNSSSSSASSGPSVSSSSASGSSRPTVDFNFSRTATPSGSTPGGAGASPPSPAQWGACWREGQCSFPTHAPGCAMGSFPWGGAEGQRREEEEAEGETKVVIVWEGDKMSVEEVPGNATVASFLAKYLSSCPSPAHSAVIRVLVNSELLDGGITPGTAPYSSSPLPNHGGIHGDHSAGISGAAEENFFPADLEEWEDEGGRSVFSAPKGSVAGEMRALERSAAAKGLLGSEGRGGKEPSVQWRGLEGFNQRLQWGDLIQIVHEQEEEGEGEKGGLPAVVSYADWLDAVGEEGDGGADHDLVSIEFHRQKLAATWQKGDRAKNREMVGV